jgi:hypothetical protein
MSNVTLMSLDSVTILLAADNHLMNLLKVHKGECTYYEHLNEPKLFHA